MTKFLNKNKVLVPTQYGFRKNRSTAHAILDIIAESYENINNNQYTGLALVDLKKPSTQSVTIHSRINWITMELEDPHSNY